MTAQLYPLPTCKMLGDLSSFLQNAFFQLTDRFAHIHLVLIRIMLIFFYSFNQVLDRFFKIKKLSVGVGRHRLKMNGECKNKIIIALMAVSQQDILLLPA